MSLRTHIEAENADAVLLKGSHGAKMSVIVDGLKARSAGAAA